MPLLANKAIKTFKINTSNIEESLSKNPILVTALNRLIGYSKAAAIAKKLIKIISLLLTWRMKKLELV